MTEGKVYAVSSGEYSDYSVSCIFERKEDALAYAASRNGISIDDQRFYDQIQGLSYDEERRLFERDERAREIRRKMEYVAFQVEEFDFYPAGVVPVRKEEK